MKFLTVPFFIVGLLATYAQAKTAPIFNSYNIPVLVQVDDSAVKTIEELKKLYPQAKSLQDIPSELVLRPNHFYVEDFKKNPEKYANYEDYQKTPDALGPYTIFKAQNEIEEKIAAATLEAKQEKYSWSLVTEVIPNSSGTKPASCYKGNPSVALDLVNSLVSLIYTEQMIAWGWKYEDKTFFAEDTDEDIESFLDENGSIWKNFDGKNGDILIVASYSDDGDDVNDIIIPLCQ